MPAKGVGNYIHVKTYTMLATRRVGSLFFSRPTVWGEVGEGNFALPPAHAQLHGPARAFLRLFHTYPLRSRPQTAWRRADAADDGNCSAPGAKQFRIGGSLLPRLMRYLRVGDGCRRQIV